MNKNLEQSLVKLGTLRPELRSHIRPLLKQAGGETFGRRLHELNVEYIQEVIEEATDILSTNGAGNVRAKMVGSGCEITGLYQGVQFEIVTTGTGMGEMTVSYEWGKAKKSMKWPLTSMSPMNVAAESLFKHFSGFID